MFLAKQALSSGNYEEYRYVTYPKIAVEVREWTPIDRSEPFGYVDESVLLQSWARVEKPNLKTSVVLAPGCLSCLEYPADDHRVWVRVPVGKHRALAFP